MTGRPRRSIFRRMAFISPLPASAASRFSRRTDGASVPVFSGGAPKGFTPVIFARTAAMAHLRQRSPETLPRRHSGGRRRRDPLHPRWRSPGPLGYLPFIDADGLWQQVGIIRFWRVSDGALRQQYDEHTGIGITSPSPFSPDLTYFAYGTYEGTAVAARTPAP
jgi:hypothetical protein